MITPLRTCDYAQVVPSPPTFQLTPDQQRALDTFGATSVGVPAGAMLISREHHEEMMASIERQGMWSWRFMNFVAGGAFGYGVAKLAGGDAGIFAVGSALLSAWVMPIRPV
jgi:hypothetical protein